MTAEELKLFIKTKAHKDGTAPQDIMQMYFFERLLFRISKSQFKHNFILKGGLLLSAIIGDERRTTQDMDTMIKGIELDEETLLPIIKEIIDLDGHDGITYEIIKTKDIRQEDIYGGLKCYLIGKKEHLQVPLTIDITIKDPITPREISFKYKCMFDDSSISIMTFTKETIIAEKLETLLHDTISNTRMKDFYDLYILIKDHYSDINQDNLIKAVIRTCKRRETLDILDNILERFEMVKSSSVMRERWNKYSSKYIFANNTSFDDIMIEIEKIIVVLTEKNKD